MNFELWINGELSKIGNHFGNKIIKKMILSKNVINQNELLNWYSSTKKN